MRILIDMHRAQDDSDNGLTDRFVHGLVDSLVRSHYDHEFILHFDNAWPVWINHWRRSATAEHNHVGISTYGLPPGVPSDRPGTEPWPWIITRLYARSVERAEPDVIVILDASGLQARASLSHINASVRRVVLVHRPISEAVGRQLDEMRHSEHFVCASQAIADQLVEKLGVLADNVTPLMTGSGSDAPPGSRSAEAVMAACAQATSKMPASADQPTIDSAPAAKPRLAFVSPLPPAPTGIANYSGELLPVLAAHYDLRLVTDQTRVDASLVDRYGEVLSPDDLRHGASAFDHVLYQVGNAPFHAFMVDLMDEVPGVSVLHDAHLGDLWLSRPEAFQVPVDGAGHGEPWAQAVRVSHGMNALTRVAAMSKEAFITGLPSSWPVIDRSRGIIVHSQHARDILAGWYPQARGAHWAVIPHLRHLPEAMDRDEARERLGLNPSDFIVATYGNVAPHKGNDLLLEAWRHSKLARDDSARLVFAGAMHSGDYGIDLQHKAARCRRGSVVFTDRLSDEAFSDWVGAADVAVQLRKHSLGESSGAVMHCLAHGLPTVVNAGGSLDELPDDSVVKIADPVSTVELAGALDQLYDDAGRRSRLGQAGRQQIAIQHSPEACAAHYARAITSAYRSRPPSADDFVDELDPEWLHSLSASDRSSLAKAITDSLPPSQPQKRVFVDVTATAATDRLTGVERVAARLAQSWLQSPPEGWRVEPVRLVECEGQWRYRTAVDWVGQLMDCDLGGVADEWVEPRAGDVLGIVDISGDSLINAVNNGLHQRIQAAGAHVFAVCHDILPMTLPHCFPPGADATHRRWMNAIAEFDTICGTSQTVRDNVFDWLKAERPERLPFVGTGSFALGSDHIAATTGDVVPLSVRDLPGESRVFLVVGTIEPRKRHQQVLDAFEQRWAAGCTDCLVIVGREGWGDLPQDARRDIPGTIRRLQDHPERGKRLHWLDNVDDEHLAGVYNRADALIAASEDEGYGLPVVEAAARGVPIIARDIPVFREVMPTAAIFFNGLDGSPLADAIEAFTQLATRSPSAREGDRTVAWHESAESLWCRIAERLAT